MTRKSMRNNPGDSIIGDQHQLDIATAILKDILHEADNEVSWDTMMQLHAILEKVLNL